MYKALQMTQINKIQFALEDQLENGKGLGFLSHTDFGSVIYKLCDLDQITLCLYKMGVKVLTTKCFGKD